MGLLIMLVVDGKSSLTTNKTRNELIPVVIAFITIQNEGIIIVRFAMFTAFRKLSPIFSNNRRGVSVRIRTSRGYY